jgi:hypothetical protein
MAYDSIAHYVNHNVTRIGSLAGASDKTYLIVGSNGNGGLTVSYSGPSATHGNWVDLGLYDAQGSRVSTLFRGAGNPGAIPVPMDKARAGTYFLRLNSNQGVQSAKIVSAKAVAVK